jgi:hypothetical protein
MNLNRPGGLSDGGREKPVAAGLKTDYITEELAWRSKEPSRETLQAPTLHGFYIS